MLRKTVKCRHRERGDREEKHAFIREVLAPHVIRYNYETANLSSASYITKKKKDNKWDSHWQESHLHTCLLQINKIWAKNVCLGELPQNQFRLWQNTLYFKVNVGNTTSCAEFMSAPKPLSTEDLFFLNACQYVCQEQQLQPVSVHCFFFFLSPVFVCSWGWRAHQTHISAWQWPLLTQNIHCLDLNRVDVWLYTHKFYGVPAGKWRLVRTSGHMKFAASLTCW